MLLGAFGAGGELVHALGEFPHSGGLGLYRLLVGVFVVGVGVGFLGLVVCFVGGIGRIGRIFGGIFGLGFFGWGGRGLIRDCFLVGLGGRRSCLIHGREGDSQRVDDFADAEC